MTTDEQTLADLVEQERERPKREAQDAPTQVAGIRAARVG
jgi:hypothetical protein